jgi:hypothetical protein
MMTRKDFELVAKLLKAERDRNACFREDRRHMVNGVLLSLAVEFANAFEEENPRFSRDLFYRACGADSPVVA